MTGGLRRLCRLIEKHFTQNTSEAVCHREVLAFASTLAEDTGHSLRDILNAGLDHARREAMDEPVTFYLDYLLTQLLGAKRRRGAKHQLARTDFAKVKPSPTVLPEIARMQNVARGTLYERIAAGLVRDHANRQFGRTDVVVEIHRRAFDCGASGDDGKRFPDLFLPEFSMMVEVKSGYVHYSRSIRAQVRKDAWLLSSGAVAEIWWFLFYGGSKRLLAELETAGVKVMDLGLADQS